ncbi:MAG: Paratox [Streptococcus salivarius]|jgi:hypothetical protein|uniref:Paratox n=1 Tax=Streptococcus salivarius TaxID=1304 RepID=A0AAW6D4S7_STRSL|nr:Paratox [Streptococcus salivarius]MDB8614618.1 Paratox [Streptococcus salivarius]MDU2712568.1 Paratox [Streptococcus salivarius]
MITIDELKEAIKKGFIKGDTVNIVRRDGKIHDYVLPGEKIDSWEVSREELLENVINELG